MGSKRKKFVNAIVIISFFTTGLFALGSILFSMRQRELSEYLDLSKNKRALKIASQLDQKSFYLELEDIEKKCDFTSSNMCIEIADIIIKLKNRAIDYEIFLDKTLDYTPDSPSIAYIKELINRIEGMSKDVFGITLSTAKEIGIKSPLELAEYRALNQKPTKVKYNRLINKINHEIVNLASVADQANKITEHEAREIEHISNNLEYSFYLLIVSEIILFLLVNGVDIINNNADPKLKNEFNFRKIQSKVRPLSASLLMAFIMMVLGQILLRNEGKQVLISSCRDNTMQSINLINSVKAQQIEDPIDLLASINTSEYCKTYFTEDALNSIVALDQRITSERSMAIELKSEALRLEADQYQDKENELSDFSKNSLFSILILNVLALSFLALHLKIDSDDIG